MIKRCKSTVGSLHICRYSLHAKLKHAVFATYCRMMAPVKLKQYLFEHKRLRLLNLIFFKKTMLNLTLCVSNKYNSKILVVKINLG